MESTGKESSPIWRVKLYELELTGTWVDHGIGHASVEMVNDLNGPALCVASEAEPGKYLMKSKIQSEDLYERQGTIILWKEADFSGTIDYALSFQDPEGFNTIWNSINEVQGQYLQQREYGNIPSFSRSHRISQNDSDNSSFTVLDDNDSSNSSYSILPTDFLSEDWLIQIKAKLGMLHPSQRDCVVSQLMHDVRNFLQSHFPKITHVLKDYVYFKSLFEKFRALENEKDLPSLRLLAEIFRLILLLNDSSTVEFLLMNDEMFKNVAGIFEYDHTLRKQGQYREFLFENARRKEVVHLSEDLSAACKFLFRLKFVRDIMLHPTIDDPGITAINSMITFTSCEICSQIMLGKEYVAEAFYQISPMFKHESLNSTLSQETLTKINVKSIDGVMFLKELFILSKFMALEKRYELYRQFFDEFYDLFVDVVGFLLVGGCRALSHGTELFTLVRHSTISSGPNNGDITGNAGTETPSTMVDIIDRSFSFRSDGSDDVVPPPSTPNPENSKFIIPSQKCFFEESFSYQEAIDMLQALGEILSVVASTYPSILRQAIITGVHPPWNPMKTNVLSGSSDDWEERSILFCLIFCILHGHDVIAIESFGEVVKTLLDFEKVTFNAKNEKEKFLHVFYDNYLPWLLLPFLEDHNPAQAVPLSFYSITNGLRSKKEGNEMIASCKLPTTVGNPQSDSFLVRSSSAISHRTGESSQSAFVIATSRRVILDIMMYCIANHSYRLKYVMLRGSVLLKILQKSFPKPSAIFPPDESICLAEKSCRHIQLYAMKLLKTVLCTKDEFYFRHIEKLDMFSYLFSTFFGVSSTSTRSDDCKTRKSICLLKDNILTSSFYDLIDYIQKEDISTLIMYLCSKFGNVFGNADLHNYVDCFDKLTVKYEQIRDRKNVPHKPSSVSNNTFGDADNSRRGGWLSNPSSKRMGKDALRLQEAEVEEDYFFGHDDCDNNDDSYHKRRKYEDDRPTPASTLASSLIIHTSISTKPPSPPHYSQRKHGSPLDGELMNSNMGCFSSNFHGNNQSPHSHQDDQGETYQKDFLSLLADYKDEDNDESNSSEGNNTTHVVADNVEDFPVIPLRVPEDEDDEFPSAFCGKKSVGLLNRNLLPTNHKNNDKVILKLPTESISKTSSEDQMQPHQVITAKNAGWEEVTSEPASSDGGAHQPVVLVLKRKSPGSSGRHH